jgi:hypothetical protein
MQLSFVLTCVWITKADQLHQFLRVQFIPARAVSILLRHRALRATIGGHVSF